MRRLTIIICILCLLLTGCGRVNVLPRQSDAADEAILRVVTLSVVEEEYVLTAVTAGIEVGDGTATPERMEGRGASYVEARWDLERRHQAAFSHTTDWVVERDALAETVRAFLIDPDLAISANLYLLDGQTGAEFLDAFSDSERDAAKAMSELDKAKNSASMTVLQAASRLAAGERCSLPAVTAKDGVVDMTGEIECNGLKPSP